MNIIMDGLSGIDAKLKVLENARRIYGTDSPHENSQWTRTSLSLRNALIAVDCENANLTQRETAAVIYGRDRADGRMVLWQ